MNLIQKKHMAKYLSVAFLRNRLLIWALTVLEEGEMGPTVKGKGK